MTPTHLRPLLRAARLAALGSALALSGCESLLRRTPPPPTPRLVVEVTRVLDVEEPSPGYYRRRTRLEVMGPELDRVLAQLITAPDTRDNVRANAVTLLADRQGENAAAVLRTVLAGRLDETVRAAAAAGLQRFATDSPAVKEALRAALRDPSERVRLAALQGMDVEDVSFIRALLPREENRQVRTVARQLVTLFEARGAPLLRDPRGDLRTTGDDSVARIVFHPSTADAGETRVGALWVELPGGHALVPLAPRVEVAGDVVPAFFDPQRRVVVFEGDGQVQVRDLRSGTTRTVGAGIAPRPIPFTDRFVFLRGPRGAGGGEVEFTVLRSTFAGAAPEPIGTLRATPAAARKLVVGEASDGFVLRGEGVTPFVLPGPYGQ
ncbi:MAG: HEAT repeat domain-containing protein [Longimicrobiaceae bacterium]